MELKLTGRFLRRNANSVTRVRGEMGKKATGDVRLIELFKHSSRRILLQFTKFDIRFDWLVRVIKIGVESMVLSTKKCIGSSRWIIRFYMLTIDRCVYERRMCTQLHNQTIQTITLLNKHTEITWFPIFSKIFDWCSTRKIDLPQHQLQNRKQDKPSFSRSFRSRREWSASSSCPLLWKSSRHSPSSELRMAARQIHFGRPS